jgi:hypothetical protein
MVSPDLSEPADMVCTSVSVFFISQAILKADILSSSPKGSAGE